MNARSFWVEQPGVGGLRTETLAALGPDQVRVRTLFTGVSRGTESLVFRGRVPLNQYAAMRCPHQVGEFSTPIKYGYIAVGVVEEGGGLEGENVFCLYPHQDCFVVDRSAVVALPKGLDPALAVLASNLETAVNGCWDADPTPNDTVTIIGAGVVGILVAWRIQAETGRPVELVDIDPGRAPVAAHLGLAFSTPEQAMSGRSLIVHASGSQAGLRSALELAGPDGRIIEMSWFGDREVSLPLGEHFHSRRLTIQCSQVGALPPRMRGEWSYHRRMALVLSLLSEHPELNILINSEGSFDSLPETMSRLAEAGAGVLCHRVHYQEK
jgi:threonine dehydrogenase-like Zn-dependent dehydrogenase